LHPDATFSFHDSEVRRVVADAAAGTLAIHFSAARVRRPGAEGDEDDEDGYLSGVELHLSGAHWEGPVAVCIGRIASGAVTVARVHLAALPVDEEMTGELRIELQFANGSQLHADAQRLIVRAGDGPLAGDFAC